LPLLVDKNKKIKLLCSLAYDEFKKYGIENFSLNQFIKKSKLSKGQFYHYFKNKEDLIFYVMEEEFRKYMSIVDERLKKSDIFLEKLHVLFSIYLDFNSDFKDFNVLVLSTLNMCINSKEKKVKEFNENLYSWVYRHLEKIFKDEAKICKLKINSQDFFRSICASADGMYLQSLMLSSYNLEDELQKYFVVIEKITKGK